jgi:hypothetical protein
MREKISPSPVLMMRKRTSTNQIQAKRTPKRTMVERNKIWKGIVMMMRVAQIESKFPWQRRRTRRMVQCFRQCPPGVAAAVGGPPGGAADGRGAEGAADGRGAGGAADGFGRAGGVVSAAAVAPAGVVTEDVGTAGVAIADVATVGVFAAVASAVDVVSGVV